MKPLILLLLIFCSGCLLAQAPDYTWVKTAGGVEYDYANDVCVDGAGNVYTVGLFRDTVDFDPGPGVFELVAVNDNDLFIQKLDPSGNLIWAIALGGPQDDEAFGVDTDSFGNVYVTGYFMGNVDFDPGPQTALASSLSANPNAFILKLTENGNFVWVKTIECNNSCAGYSLDVSSTNDVHITGRAWGVVDLDPGVGVSSYTSGGSNDIFIVKLNGQGDFQWGHGLGGFDWDIGNSIKTNAQGDVLVCGNFDATVDFDPGPGVFTMTAGGIDDGFVLCLSVQGDFLWANQTGDNGQDIAFQLDISPLDKVYVSGKYQNTVDLDPGPGTVQHTSQGGNDIYVQKFNGSGDLEWAKSIGGTLADNGDIITVDSFENVYLSGRFEGTIDSDPGPGVANLVSEASQDIFLIKLDENGDFVWSKSFGGPGQQWSNGIAIDDGQNIYLSGFLYDSVEYQTNSGSMLVQSNGSSDAFVARISQCSAPANTVQVVEACDSYTWIDGVTYTSSNNTASFTLVGSDGCDSIVTLDLTITTVDPTITISPDGTTLTAIQANATYQWLDCDANLAPLIGETNNALTPTITGNYGVVVTVGSCSDTSVCASILVNNIPETEGLQEIKIYPNPADATVTVELSQQAKKATLYNGQGQILMEREINDNLFELDLPVEGGVYIIEVALDSGERIRRPVLRK